MSRGALLIFGLAALPAVGVARPVRNSFVNLKVASTAQLLAHVRTDQEVADRYERHFAMDRPTVLRYLGSLHRGSLERSGYYTIYSVPQGGRLKMHVGRIPKGEPMFMDGRGKPILVVKCGNPVVLGPTRARRANPLAAGLVPEEDGTRTLDSLTDLPSTSSDVLALTPDAPSDLVAETPSSAPMAPTEGAPMAVGASSPGGSFGGLGGFLPLLGVIPIASHGLGKGGTQAVPEPITLVALGAGAAALARRRRK